MRARVKSLLLGAREKIGLRFGSILICLVSLNGGVLYWQMFYNPWETVGIGPKIGFLIKVFFFTMLIFPALLAAISWILHGMSKIIISWILGWMAEQRRNWIIAGTATEVYLGIGILAVMLYNIYLPISNRARKEYRIIRPDGETVNHTISNVKVIRVIARSPRNKRITERLLSRLGFTVANGKNGTWPILQFRLNRVPLAASYVYDYHDKSSDLRYSGAQVSGTIDLLCEGVLVGSYEVGENVFYPPERIPSTSHSDDPDHAPYHKAYAADKLMCDVLCLLGSVGRLDCVEHALRSSDWRLCLAATQALGEIGDQNSLTTLAEITNDQNRNVRKAAREATEGIVARTRDQD